MFGYGEGQLCRKDYDSSIFPRTRTLLGGAQDHNRVFRIFGVLPETLVSVVLKFEVMQRNL